MTTIDQNIWKERVKKEQAGRQKFNLVSMINAQTGSQCSNYAVTRTYLRDSQPPAVVKMRPFYMIDSTYTVACNPNTMRDTGPLRNACYRVSDPADIEYLKRTTTNKQQTRDSAHKDEKRYQDTLASRCTHKRPQSQVNSSAAQLRKSAFSFADSSHSHIKPARVVESVTLVATNDYTKNISEYLFSPALKTRPSTAANKRYKDINNKLATKSAVALKQQLSETKSVVSAASAQRYLDIERDLKNEKEKKDKLREDVKKIKEQMDSIQKSVKSAKQ